VTPGSDSVLDYGIGNMDLNNDMTEEAIGQQVDDKNTDATEVAVGIDKNGE
jgi:hypothetical protein